MSETAELWQEHNALRDKVHALESRMSAHDAKHEIFVEEFRESRRERKEQIEAIAKAINTRLEKFDEKIDVVTTKVSEAHGAARFGKWVVGILIALGVPSALFAWYSHAPQAAQVIGK